jgi:hypothetical protein
VRPDVLVEDNVVLFPALATSGAPFVRIVSCNPLEVPGTGVAPGLSGLAQADPGSWAPFRAELERTHRPMWEAFNAWVVEQGAAPLPDLEFIADGDLNLYVYPAVLDYVAERPLGPTWHRLESSVRETDEAYDVPSAGKTIYFSLGSLGSADVELMRRIIAALAQTPHRYIVSMGPLHDSLELADNMTGAEIAAEAARLRSTGYGLEALDREELADSPTVRRQFRRRVQLGFSDVFRFTTPEGGAFAYFVGGAHEATALISLDGDRGRRATDRRVAALLASQV